MSHIAEWHAYERDQQDEDEGMFRIKPIHFFRVNDLNSWSYIPEYMNSSIVFENAGDTTGGRKCNAETASWGIKIASLF